MGETAQASCVNLAEAIRTFWDAFIGSGVTDVAIETTGNRSAVGLVASERDGRARPALFDSAARPDRKQRRRAAAGARDGHHG
jgi:hypothetical protein